MQPWPRTLVSFITHISLFLYYWGMWGVKIGVLGYAQFIYTLSSCLTCIFHVHLHGFKLKISLILTFDWIIIQRWVRGQSGGSWGWQTQLDHSQVCSTCISRAYTCIHVKYTCYTPGNGLVVFATLKNPYFDPSHISEASEILSCTSSWCNQPPPPSGMLNFWFHLG